MSTTVKIKLSATDDSTNTPTLPEGLSEEEEYVVVGVDHGHKKDRTVVSVLRDGVLHVLPDEEEPSPLQARVVSNALDRRVQLTDRQRRVIALRAVDTRWEEIARGLKITVERAKTLYRNAKRKIDRELKTR